MGSPVRIGGGGTEVGSFQFIEFPSEWGEKSLTLPGLGTRTCFQFIEFPSEWGVSAICFLARDESSVSNLLSSPASGEKRTSNSTGKGYFGFQFIEFPSEWGENSGWGVGLKEKLFPIY